MNDRNQLSPGGAWAMGALFIGCGLIPVLVALGVLPAGHPSADGAPPWMTWAIGIAFMTAGICIIVDYGFGRFTMMPDGDFPDGTPMAMRLANLVLGGIIVASMTAMFGWIAFGPGPRHFSVSIAIPFLPVALSQRSSDISGRIAFGFATIVFAFMFVACTVVGIRRLLLSSR